MSIEKYWQDLNDMPEDLREIVTANYDYTGRPVDMKSYENVILSLLKKNASIGGESFLEDMKVVFPDVMKEDAAIYYNVFISGAKYIAEKLNKN